jgi:TolA-binding protein
MKSSERHHLKENELAHSLEQARGLVGNRGRQIGGVLVAVVAVIVVIAGIVAFRQRSQSQGDVLLAEAMVALNARVVPPQTEGGTALPAGAELGATGAFPTEDAKLNAALPKLKAAADGYPDSPSGITARYHMAGTLAALGRLPEATTAFEDVAKRAGASSLYGRMARLGQADAQARAGQVDQAITTWTALVSETGSELPVDAILLELARAYAAKGNAAEARKAFTRILDEHPDSAYSTEARAELDTLKGA